MDINNTQHTIQTIIRDNICRLKSEEGLWIKKAEDVNAIFLARQGCELLT